MHPNLGCSYSVLSQTSSRKAAISIHYTAKCFTDITVSCMLYSAQLILFLLTMRTFARQDNSMKSLHLTNENSPPFPIPLLSFCGFSPIHFQVHVSLLNNFIPFPFPNQSPFSGALILHPSMIFRNNQASQEWQLIHSQCNNTGTFLERAA